MWQQRLRPLPCSISSKMGMRSGMVSWHGIRICDARVRAGAIESQLYSSGGAQHSQAVGVPYAADHNLTRLYQLSVNYKHTQHSRITAAVITLLRPRDNADNQNTSKSCKVHFQLKPLKQRFSRAPRITNKIFPLPPDNYFMCMLRGIQVLFESIGKRSRCCFV
jgi:hypothetical protein